MMTIREDAQKKMLFIQIPEEFEKAKSRENEFEEQMILTCRIKGLLSVKKGWQGEQALYGADIQGCRALSAYDSPLKKLPDLALQLPRIIQNLEDFLLSPDHLLLEADRIFFNDAGEIKLLYLPFYASDVRQQSIQLAADLRPGLYDEKDLFSSRFQRCLVENTVPWEALSRLGREAFHDEKGEGLAATSYDTMAEGDEESFWYGKEEKEKSPLIYESRESRHGTVEEKEWLGDEKKEKTGKEGKDRKKKVKNAREAFEDKAFRRAGKAGTEEAYENQRFDSKADREEKDEVGLGSTRRWVALAAATAALVIVNFFVLRSGILEGSAEKVAALCGQAVDFIMENQSAAIGVCLLVLALFIWRKYHKRKDRKRQEEERIQEAKRRTEISYEKEPDEARNHEDTAVFWDRQFTEKRFSENHDKKPQEPPIFSVVGKTAEIDNDAVACLMPEKNEGKSLPFRLAHRQYIVGKEGTGADIRLKSSAVNAIHAIFGWTDKGYYVSDLNSRNGTRINNRLIPGEERCYLSDGDRVAFGDTAFTFCFPRNSEMTEN